MKTGTIYKITHLESRKSYIGQTINDPRQRWAQHWNYSKRAKATGKRLGHLNKAMLRYGRDAFEYTILESGIQKEDLDRKEVEAILEYDTFNNGYNLNSGGALYGEADFEKEVYIPTEDHKKAMSEAKVGVTPISKYLYVKK